ncbi:MAG TPA: M56 family metallopeptidase [Vicinamibacterales bacterium]|nr:M56 family metallopeptidase [Vicinamibacterales bacterium]
MTGVAAALVAYVCQVSALAGAAWLALVVGRVRAPRLQLLHYQATLVAAVVLLPCLAIADLSITSPAAVMFSAPRVFAATTVGAEVHAASLVAPWTIAGLVLVAGMAVRATWLAMGLLRLRRVRIAARELNPPPPAIANLEAALGVKARWFSTDAVAVAATYGVRHPVVLLPPADLGRADAALRAIAGHELCHVARRDWLRRIGEEVVRTALWYHPAIWFLIDRIRLCREQVVDAEVIVMTGDRRAYAEALIESAATLSDPPLAPAWLQARHLRARIVSIAAAGGPMSRTRFLSSAAALVVVLAAACTWSACAFPSHDDQGTAVAPSPAAGSAAASSTRAPTEGVPPAAGDASMSAEPSTATHATSEAASATAQHGRREVSSSPRPRTAVDAADVPSAYTIGNGVISPRVVSMVKPQYTPDAIKAKIAGDVWIEAVVDAHGAPTNLRVTRSLDTVYGLDQEALKAAQQWKFKPGLKDGESVPVKVTLVLEFRLR